MKKNNSYNKLKQENIKLKQDIYNLVKKENELEGIKTKAEYLFIFNMQECKTYGLRKENISYKLEGIYNLINSNKKERHY